MMNEDSVGPRIIAAAKTKCDRDGPDNAIESAAFSVAGAFDELGKILRPLAEGEALEPSEQASDAVIAMGTTVALLIACLAHKHGVDLTEPGDRPN